MHRARRPVGGAGQPVAERQENPTTTAKAELRRLLYFDLFLPDDWTWSENIYISGGIDDPFNAGTFDYFAGLGITFNDKDLKALLTVAPSP